MNQSTDGIGGFFWSDNDVDGGGFSIFDCDNDDDDFDLSFEHQYEEVNILECKRKNSRTTKAKAPLMNYKYSARKGKWKSFGGARQASFIKTDKRGRKGSIARKKKINFMATLILNSERSI